jgi:hypothetical protein
MSSINFGRTIPLPSRPIGVSKASHFVRQIICGARSKQRPVPTCVGVRRMMLARCSRSGADRYRCCRNLRSSSYVCAFENRTLLLRFLVLPGCVGAWLPDSWCPSDSGSSSSVSSRWSSPSCPMSGALMIADDSVLDESGPGPLEGLLRRGGKLSRETELEWRSGSCSVPPLVGSGGARELGEVLSGLTCCCWAPGTWRLVKMSFSTYRLDTEQRNKLLLCYIL